MRHPFPWLIETSHNRGLVYLLLLALVLMTTLNVLDVPLRTERAPAGIISFELAGSLPLAQEMIESWGTGGAVRAGLSLGLDFVFLMAYGGGIALGCVLLGRSLEKHSRMLAILGVWLSWLVLAAALLDAMENYALIRVLLGSSASYWPLVARVCAIPKFALILASLAYLILGSVGMLIKRGFGRRSR